MGASIWKGRWMDALWLVEVLITHPHPSRGARLLGPLILGCFRGHMSLLVHHFLVCNTISHAHIHTYTHTHTHTHSHTHTMSGRPRETDLLWWVWVSHAWGANRMFSSPWEVHWRQTEWKAQQVSQTHLLYLQCLLKSGIEYYFGELFLFFFFGRIFSHAARTYFPSCRHLNLLSSFSLMKCSSDLPTGRRLGIVDISKTEKVNTSLNLLRTVKLIPPEDKRFIKMSPNQRE